MALRVNWELGIILGRFKPLGIKSERERGGIGGSAHLGEKDCNRGPRNAGIANKG